MIERSPAPFRSRLRGHAGWLVAGPAAVLVLLLYPHQRIGPMCAFRRFSGFPCPTCGFTRAFFALARGHWAEVARNCPAAIPVFSAVGLLLVAGLVSLATGWTIRPGPRWRGRGRPWVWVLIAAAAVLLANWAFRLSRGLV